METDGKCMTRTYINLVDSYNHHENFSFSANQIAVMNSAVNQMFNYSMTLGNVKENIVKYRLDYSMLTTNEVSHRLD